MEEKHTQIITTKKTVTYIVDENGEEKELIEERSEADLEERPKGA